MQPHARIALVRSSLLSLGLALAGSVASPSGALAGTVPVSGGLTLAIATLTPITVTGGGIATVEGSGGGAHVESLGLPANLFATVARQVVITDPAAAPIMGIQLTAQNGAGAFAGDPLGGTMPLLGTAKVCLFGDCNSALANLSIPLSVVGVGGTRSVTVLVNVTVEGHPWTTGTAPLGTGVIAGFAHGPASGTSSTAAPSGAVRLVSPVFVFTNIGSSIPAFAVLDLHFVPEPGTLMLLGSGIVGLVAMGRRLRKS